jgi:hypothetical protein
MLAADLIVGVGVIAIFLRYESRVPDDAILGGRDMWIAAKVAFVGWFYFSILFWAIVALVTLA